MPADTEATRAKIAKTLTEWIGSADVDERGRFVFRRGVLSPVFVFIDVQAYGEQFTVVGCHAVTNVEVPPSPELFQFLATATDRFLFGHIGAMEEAGAITVNLSHTSMGESMSPEDLKFIVSAIAQTADDIDDVIKERFGGRTYHEYLGVS